MTLAEARHDIHWWLKGEALALWTGLEYPARNEWAQRVLDGDPAENVAASFQVYNSGASGLIAAAPDLLALAQHLLAMETDAHLSEHPEWEVIVDEARAAIARAEGGAA